VALESFYSLVNRTLGLKPRGFRDDAAVVDTGSVTDADPAADVERG
jgi:hypothetical protein